MSNLVLVKSETFGSVQCDFYKGENGEILLTRKQIGEALEYADPQKAIDNLHSKHQERLDRFSVTLKVRGADKKQYPTTLYRTKGVYEICRWSQQPKADLFYDWVYEMLEALRTGETLLIKPTTYQLNLAELKRQELEIKAKNAEARLKNATVRQASFLLKEVDKHKNVLSVQSVELITINAFEMITGGHALPRTQVEKTYTATEIGEELGVSSNKIGKVANANNLKTDEYGITVLDKSPYSSKQVPSFRYNEKGRKAFRELLGRV